MGEILTKGRAKDLSGLPLFPHGLLLKKKKKSDLSPCPMVFSSYQNIRKYKTEVDWGSCFSLHLSDITSVNAVILGIKFILWPTWWWERTPPLQLFEIVGCYHGLKKDYKTEQSKTSRAGGTGWDGHLLGYFKEGLHRDISQYRGVLLKDMYFLFSSHQLCPLVSSTHFQ